MAVVFVAAFFDPEEVLAAEESMGMGLLGEGLEIGLGLGLLVLMIYSSVALYQLKPKEEPCLQSQRTELYLQFVGGIHDG